MLLAQVRVKDWIVQVDERGVRGAAMENAARAARMRVVYCIFEGSSWWERDFCGWGMQNSIG